MHGASGKFTPKTALLTKFHAKAQIPPKKAEWGQGKKQTGQGNKGKYWAPLPWPIVKESQRCSLSPNNSMLHTQRVAVRVKLLELVGLVVARVN